MSWNDAEAAFAQALPGYESRAAQQGLAHAIEDNFAAHGHLLAQAGTGTGKSLAGLVPAIFHALKCGQPVAVATATKALQDQYAGKDLPFLQEVFAKQLGLDFRFAVLKGRGNYLCRAKLAELAPETVFNQNTLLEEIDARGAELSGDLDDLVTEIDMRDKPKLTSSSDECPGKSDCPFGQTCFAVKAKERAQEAEIVVVNDSILVMDAKLRADSKGNDGRPTISLLPDLSGVVIDEAHELEEYATGALGNEFSERTITALANELTSFIKTVDATVSSDFGLHGAAKGLFDHLTRMVKESRSSTLIVTTHTVLDRENEFYAILDALNIASGTLKSLYLHGDDRAAQRRKRLNKRIGTLADRVKSVMLADDSDLVRWVEIDAKRGTILKFAPLHVGNFLREHIWDQIPAVLLSATLALGTDFSYIAGRLGLNTYESFDAGTPFDYPKQSRIFVPQNFDPSPANSANWKAKVTATIPELVGAAGGRALLLFTSAAAMKEAYDNTSGALKRMGLTVLAQGQQPNRVLAERFKEDETSVLFALKSFMTGFDVQGDALRLVIIDKLPFTNPNDVIFAARCAAIDKYAHGFMDKSFMKLAVPSMALVLLQAVGRLIRTMSDEGMVVVLDSRLIDPKKGYMRTVRNAMPPSRQLHTMAEAKDYLGELVARRG